MENVDKRHFIEICCFIVGSGALRVRFRLKRWLSTETVPKWSPEHQETFLGRKYCHKSKSLYPDRSTNAKNHCVRKILQNWAKSVTNPLRSQYSKISRYEKQNFVVSASQNWFWTCRVQPLGIKLAGSRLLFVGFAPTLRFSVRKFLTFRTKNRNCVRKVKFNFGELLWRNAF